MHLPWPLSSSDDCHEQVFVERLGKVLLWARQITSGDTSLAEDLAQDAFLHFTTGRPPLNEIANVDKYLYVVLKNLFRSHLASVSRRSAVPFDPLAHEDAMQTWRSVNPEHRLTLRDELRRICVFVCDRKETSKGASAFLLHFFHNLSVADVSILMQTTRGAVDERLSVMRKEMRRWLDRPAPKLVRTESSEADLMAELQSVIASSRRGDCFSTEEARLRYTPEAAELPKDRLAHLASCAQCLSLVADLLEFPNDSELPPSSTSCDQNRIPRWRRKRAELLASDPAELRLIVNGHLLATERVHHPDNNFTVSVALHEPLEFVEVWNGESDRLLLLAGISEPPDGKFDQSTSVELNAGKLHLNVRFTEPWPTVAIQYQTCIQENAEPARTLTADRRVDRRLPVFRLFSIPALSTLLALAMIVVLLFVQTKQTTLSAAELLNRVEKWEQNVVTEGAPVLHRRFTLTKQHRGAPSQQTFVDVWRRASQNVKWSRWTDASGHILAEAKIAGSTLPPLDETTIWQFDPSVDAFLIAASEINRATVSATWDRTVIHSGFAELVLDRKTNRPVSEKLSVNGSDYVFSESSTENISVAASPFSTLSITRPGKAKPLHANKQPSAPTHASLDSKPELRELQVRRELHALGLAARASVQRDGDTIEVNIPTSIEQDGQLQAAFENIPGVQISLIDPQTAVRESVAIENLPPPLQRDGRLKEPLASRWLKAFIGSEAEIQAEEERRVEAARRLVSLAAEWRLLAERYPRALETRLSAEAQPLLNEIVEDLRTRIRQDVNAERTAVYKLLPNAADSTGRADSGHLCEGWQSQAISAADLLWENDQAVEQFYAPAAATTAADSSRLARLRNLTDDLDSVFQGSCSVQ